MEPVRLDVGEMVELTEAIVVVVLAAAFVAIVALHLRPPGKGKRSKR